MAHAHKLFLWSSLGILSVTILSSNIVLAASTQSNLENNSQNNLSIALKAMPTDENVKIEYQLQRSLEIQGTDEISILIDLNGEYDQFSDALRQSGFKAHRAYSNLVQGRVDKDDIAKLASLQFVNFIREPVRPVFYKVVSQGVSVLKADIAQSIEQTGKGAKLAVIDGGFDVTNPEISTNIVEARSFIDGVGIAGDDPTHGTAVAEIIVDVAPNVQLYLYAIGTGLDFIDAVNYAVSKNVDIISMSIGFINLGPYDGSSAVSKVLEQARNSGVLPIVAVGNDAQNHWKGVFQDPNSNKWANIAGSYETNDFYLNQGQKVSVYLSWNDWWLSDQDYDLFLFRDSGGSLIEVARSQNRQLGNQWPTEKITYTADTSGTYYIAIYRLNALGNAEFHLFTTIGELQYQVPSESITNVADAKGAIAVGAFYWANNTLEPFSSRGPTLDGRIKPDIIAPDGVKTTANPSFYGTSAAAPHIAGIAALMVGSSPSITADEIAKVLENTAVDMGESGKDNLYGSGRAETKYSTLDVSPRIVSIIVDGKEFPPSVLPRKFLVDGKAHSASLSSTAVAQIDTRYAFKKWSDGYASPSTNILFDGSWQTKLAQFGVQYLLSIKTNYGTPSGEGWYDAGTIVPFSIPSTVDQGNRTRRVFTSWTGVATSTNPSATIVMDSPKVVTALWKKQYELVIISSNQATTGQGWYDTGSTASFSVRPEISYGNDTRRAFKYWSGDFAGSETSGSIVLNTPKILEVIWRTQYHIKVDSPIQAGFQGVGWYDAGDMITLTGRNIWNLKTNQTRMNLKSYSLDGETFNLQRKASGNSTITAKVNKPHSIKIIGGNQFFFNVKGGSKIDFGTPSPTGDLWWDEDQSTNVSTEYVWDLVERKNRSNLMAYSLDGTRYEVARANSSRFRTPSIVFTEPKNLVFESVMQYRLNVGGGYQVKIEPSSPITDNWFDTGSNIVVSASHIWDTGQQGVRRQLASWQIDQETPRKVVRFETGAFQTERITMDQPREVKLLYVFQYLLDVSSNYNKPIGGGWYDEGAAATISLSPLTIEHGNRTRHSFTSWGGDLTTSTPTASLTMNSPKTVLAVWKTQYELKVESPYGNPQGSGWHDRGSKPIFSVTPTEDHRNSTRRVFIRWSGDSIDSSPTSSLTMSAPKTVIVEWKTQYYLKVSSDYGNPEGEGWYDKDSKADFSVTTPPDHGNGTRRIFAQWTGDSTDRSPISSLIIDSPKSLVAKWTTEYFLRVRSDLGDSKGEGWYEKGIKATFSLLSPLDYGNGTRHVFISWIGDSVETEATASIVMNLPKSVTAKWKTQHFLKVTSNYGSPEGEGWYDSGKLASVKVSTPIDWMNQTRHVFTSWTGDITQDAPAGSITITSPKRITANWKTQYVISMIFTDSNGQRVITPSSIKVIGERGGETELKEYNRIWIDRDRYTIDNVSWMALDVKDPDASTFTISKPEEIEIPTRIYSLEIVVKDIVSLPISGAKVTIELANGTLTTLQTDEDGVIKLPLVPLGSYSATIEVLGLKSEQVGDASILPKVKVTMLLSIPIVIGIVAVASFAIGSLFLIRRKSIKRHIE